MTLSCASMFVLPSSEKSSEKCCTPNEWTLESSSMVSPDQLLSAQIDLEFLLSEANEWKNFVLASPSWIQSTLLFSFQVRIKWERRESFLLLNTASDRVSTSEWMLEGWEERRDTMARLISASSLVLCLFFSFSRVLTSVIYSWY